MTDAELSALPEFVGTRLVILPSGDTVIERIAPRFCAHVQSPDDVFMFSDANGSWFVDYHLEGGPYKRRAC